MDKTELTILGSAAAVALIVAAGVLLWIFVIAGGEDENLDDPLIESRLEEMKPLCVDITLGVLTPDEIKRTVGEAADGKPFFHEGAAVEEALGMPYSEISAECTRAAVRGFDAGGEYFEHVSACSNALREDTADEPLRKEAADKPPIERLRQVVACADELAGVGAAGEDADENPDEESKG